MDIEEYLASRRTLINESVAKFVSARYDNEMMRVATTITLHGKRLRGALTCLVCEALGGAAEDAMVAAVAVEFVHAASLAHDDIQDGDATRRGRPAAWSSYGLMKAIMVPHVMVPHAALFVSQYGLRAMWSLIDHWSQVTRGQVSDLPEFRRVGSVSLPVQGEEYVRIIRDKTAAGFELAAELGARAARRDWLITPAQKYGEAVGVAYQVADDACDLLEAQGQAWASLGKNGKVAVSLQALRLMLARQDAGEAIAPEQVGAAWELAGAWVQTARDLARALQPQPAFTDLLLDFPAMAVRAIRDEAEQKVREREEATSGGA